MIVGKIGGSHYVMPGNYYLLPEVPSSGEDELSLEESSSLIENLIAQGGRGEKVVPWPRLTRVRSRAPSLSSFKCLC